MGSARGCHALHWVRGCAFAYTVALTYALAAPAPLATLGQSGVAVEEAIDRSVTGAVQHVAAYAGLAVLWCWGLRSRSAWPSAVGLAAVHGLACEALQVLVPNRHCDWFDMLANVAGVLAGLGLALLLPRRALPLCS